jgi:hypothetical protein
MIWGANSFSMGELVVDEMKKIVNFHTNTTTMPFFFKGACR